MTEQGQKLWHWLRGWTFSGLRARAVMVQLATLFAIGFYMFAIWAPQAISDQLALRMIEVRSTIATLGDGLSSSILDQDNDAVAHKIALAMNRHRDWQRVELRLQDQTAPKFIHSRSGSLATDKMGENRQQIALPMDRFGKQVGELRVIVDNTDRLAMLVAAEYRLAAALVVSYLIMLSVSIALLDRQVCRPILRLHEATNRMATGDLETALATDRSAGEVADLHRRIDQLRQSLAQQQTDLRQAAEHAEQANREKSRFLATMSHEIRTPMNGILGMLDLLQETALDEVQSQCAESARICSESLLALINDVLDMSRMEAGGMTLADQPFELPRIIDQAVAVVTPRAQDNDLALSVEIAPDVPSALMGDGDRLRQVLVNLLGNAVKFTEEGSIRVQAGCDQGRLRLSVTDTGIGIANDQQDRLFTAFTQIESDANRRYLGTGLGLAICRHLVALMDGEITVTSTPGQGSVFTLDLPLRLVQRERDKASDLFVLERQAARLRVLVVDDDPIGRELVAAMVAPRVALVETADSAQQALDRIIEQGQRYDLLLTDHVMPEMDGAELVARLRQLPLARQPGCYVMISGLKGREQQAARQSGLVHHFITRPMRHKDLLRVLKLALTAPTRTQDSIDEVPGLTTACTEAGGLTPAMFEAVERAPERQERMILLAEDNPVNQKVASAHLRRAGYQVIAVENGALAVQAVREHGDRLAIILMDIQMPGMDGRQATAEIRALDAPSARLPIIALTANAMPGDRDSFLAAGMDDYLAKPFRKSALLSMVERWCCKRSSTDAA
ncbi:MAG: hypothetical protein Alpg2KO_08880 [Alphaproteobacteria bacterium]